jgi:hypothetical protein
MKLSKNSKELMLFFMKHNNINNGQKSKRTDGTITELYNNIYQSYEYLNSLKKKGNYYNILTKQILNVNQISKPKNFNSNSFPSIVRNHIDSLSMTEITYQFSLYGRSITVHFIIEEDHRETKIETFNRYVDAIIMWLYILNQYASKKCVASLVIYLYFTSLEKHLPESSISILNEINVNTAFTTTCPKDSEIVVFRKEEWFKVLIHETFHNFGLDFSDMNNTELNKCILNIFKVNSFVNIYEAYTEFWAEIMNALFCSFFSLKDKKNIDEFLSNADFFINFEITYSFFQLVKILKFMGLSYKTLYSKSEISRVARENLYKEKTNVLSYYIIKTNLINNYHGFLFWCKKHNSSLLQFDKTVINQMEFCKFIEKNYKTTSMLNGIDETQEFLNNIHKKSKQPNVQYMLSNMRMSICELG